MGQHQLCDADADHTVHRGPGHEGRGEEQDQKRIQLPQLSPDRRCGKAVQNFVTAGANLPQPLRQGLHRQRLRVHLGGWASLLTRLCEPHLPQAAEEVQPAPHPLSRPAPHLRQHAAVLLNSLLSRFLHPPFAMPFFLKTQTNEPAESLM